MEGWKWRRIADDTTPLDEYIRLVNSRMAKLATALEQHQNALIGVDTFNNGAAQPSVYGARVWLAANTVATSITHFRDGEQGQHFTLIATTGNTTVENTATVKTKTGANVVLAANQTMQFVTPDGFNWREI
jgi:Zn-dependent alcohol dehydrogenase